MGPKLSLLQVTSLPETIRFLCRGRLKKTKVSDLGRSNKQIYQVYCSEIIGWLDGHATFLKLSYLVLVSLCQPNEKKGHLSEKLFAIAIAYE